MTKLYSTVNDALEQEVLPAIDEFAGDYDLEKIAEEAIEYVEYRNKRGQVLRQGFAVIQGPAFWEIVEGADRSRV